MSDTRRALAEVVLRKLLAEHPALAERARQIAQAHLEREAAELTALPKVRRYSPPPEAVVDEVAVKRAEIALGLNGRR